MKTIGFRGTLFSDTPKWSQMDGLFHGTSENKMDDLGVARHGGRIRPYLMWGRSCPTEGGGRGAADPRVGVNVTRPRFAWQEQ